MPLQYRYRKLLSRCGEEVVKNGRLSEDSIAKLARPLIPQGRLHKTRKQGIRRKTGEDLGRVQTPKDVPSDFAAMTSSSFSLTSLSLPLPHRRLTGTILPSRISGHHPKLSSMRHSGGGNSVLGG